MWMDACICACFSSGLEPTRVRWERCQVYNNSETSVQDKHVTTGRINQAGVNCGVKCRHPPSTAARFTAAGRSHSHMKQSTHQTGAIDAETDLPQWRQARVPLPLSSSEFARRRWTRPCIRDISGRVQPCNSTSCKCHLLRCNCDCPPYTCRPPSHGPPPLGLHR